MSKEAFSIAESFIMLIITSIAIGLSAPMITKQIKHNNLSNTQTTLLNGEIERIRTQSNANSLDIDDLQLQINGKVGLDALTAKADAQTVTQLQQRIEELETRLEEGLVPRGTIAFFAGNCPAGWSQVSTNWNGRFPRFAGNYNVCNVRGENATGSCIAGVAASVTNNVGRYGGDTIRNATGAFNMSMRDDNSVFRPWAIQSSGVFTNSWHSQRWSISGGGGMLSNYTIDFNLSNSIPTGVETQPKFITLMGCVKN